ncbi:MAG: SMC-Scp complex subunit ScpB [Zetaproteobacteria bacterium]|nr:MAG: SMC-Scp complex subunit ScpB [Zetaproteobacteria bacterium]
MLKQQLEALIFASDVPLSMQRLRELTQASSNEIHQLLAELQTEYADRGIRLCRIAEGWQFRTDPGQAEIVRRLWESRPPKLSRALLETLAIIAYRQPVTRAEIEALRGIKTSSSIISTLQERGWIKVVGRKEVPGRPQLLATTRQFLIDFSLNSLDDLPDASQLLDEGEIEQLVLENIADTRKEAIESHEKP